MMAIPCATILVAITGSVAATVMPSFVLELRRRGIGRVDVLMTRSACRFVSPYALRLHAGTWVYNDLFSTAVDELVPHIALPEAAEIFLIMPATANIIGKAANGICDDLVSAAIIAAQCPLVFVPSMNGTMWTNPAVQENVEKLRSRGHIVMDPVNGLEILDLQQTGACMPSFPAILDLINQLATASPEGSR